MSGLSSFYAGRRVLVTGHTGFKGSWLCLWLSRMGADVTGFALAPDTEPSLFAAAKVAQKTHSIIGDIRERETLAGAVRAARPEIVLHLAAQSLVRRSYREPVETYATNVMGTVHLLEACRTLDSVRACVVVTSDKCYENREWERGYTEADALGGHDPYSSSKACAEIVTAAYRRSFLAERGIGLGSARAGNVIGGGDWSEDRLLPDIVRGAVSGTPTRIRNPRSTRPWQHVLEPLSGYLLLARRLIEEPAKHAEAWNFGPDDDSAVEVGEVATRFVERLGRGKLELGTPPASAEPHEARWLKLDASKARDVLGWRPRLGLDASIGQTAAWYRAYLEAPESAAAETLAQIDAYLRGLENDAPASR